MKDIETGEEIVFDTYISIENPYDGEPLCMELDTFREEKEKDRENTLTDKIEVLDNLSQMHPQEIKERFFILDYCIIQEYGEESKSDGPHSVFIPKKGKGFKKILEYLTNKDGLVN